MKTSFGDKIKTILKSNGYFYKIRYEPRGESFRRGKKVVCDYDKVTIYAGRSIEKSAVKRSRKLVAWRNLKGEWEGDLDVVQQQGGKGSAIYVLDYHDKTEPLKYVMFSDLDWNDDEKYARNKMLKILENWKFVEKEREKLKTNP